MSPTIIDVTNGGNEVPKFLDTKETVVIMSSNLYLVGYFWAVLQYARIKRHRLVSPDAASVCSDFVMCFA